MSERIIPGSPHWERARIFAATLQAAKIKRKASLRGLSEASGVNRSQMMFYLRGHNIPSVKTAARLAEALDEPAILRLAVEARTRPCKRCQAPVVSGMGRPPDYCSPSCKYLAAPRQRAAAVRQAEVMTSEVRIYRKAIAQMCEECADGETGVCTYAECALRPVSPLQLAEREVKVVKKVKAIA